MDDGRLTDGQGRTVDFTQALVLMTSNLRTQEQVRAFFRPEFLNRLDEVLVFEPLGAAEIHRIVLVQIQRLARHLAEQDIEIELTPTAVDALAREGFDPEFGARPLKRAIQRHVQNPIAEAILGGKLVRGQKALVDSEDDHFVVHAIEGKPSEVEARA
jgi:ATP-dependent Clp protease ATP-binding subunit ClpB